MSDKYGKSESNDIIEDLGSLKPEKQKAAVKKVISAMTIGRDVSKLFPHIVKCIATQDSELKKLVYLYIINYSRIRPLESLLAVNHLKKDSTEGNSNPLMRALAVRTMGCLGVEEVMQFLCDPLKDALKDRDPYVRKTAVICVAKVFDINRQLVEEQFCFIEILQKLIENEGNSMVIANSVASLIEISNSKGADVLKMTWKKCKCLLTALHENNEWCQIYLLEGISKYYPQTQEEIAEIIERVVPMVSHSNSGVVLTAIKILIKLLDIVQTPDTIRNVCKKITPSLVTLLSAEREIQYVALKNINILIQKRPIIFEKDIKMFFCNFTEPIYNKMEKLEILYKLVTMNNIDLVLNELKEYASEVDVQFVKRAVRLIGQCAIKLEKAAQRCVETLVELVKTQVSFVIQEAIIALRDIFRRYPNNFEGAMQIVNENLRSLNDANSKSALIWIIGEYSDRIDGAEIQLTKFLDNLKEESYDVQLQILNAAVKTYLKVQSKEAFDLLSEIFEFTNNQSDNVDLRERGYIYFRLLELDPQIACSLILTDKPRISEEANVIEGSLLDKLVDNLGTLATIFNKPPEAFVKRPKKVINIGEEEENDYEENVFNIEKEGPNSNKDFKAKEDIPSYSNEKNKREETSNVKINSSNVDLLDLNSITYTSNNNPSESVYTQGSNSQFISNQGGMGYNMSSSNYAPGNTNANNVANLLDSLSLLTTSQVVITQSQVQQTQGSVLPAQTKYNNKYPAIIPKKVVLDESVQGSKNGRTGIIIEASVQRDNNLYLILSITNKSNVILSGFEIQFNTNYYGINCSSNSICEEIVNINSTSEFKIDLFTNVSCDIKKVPNVEPPFLLQAAIRCNLDEYFFRIPVLFCVLFENERMAVAMDNFIRFWQNIPNRTDMVSVIENINPKYQNTEAIINRLENNNLYYVNRKENNGQDQLFFCSKLTNEQMVLVSVEFSNMNPNNAKIFVKTQEQGDYKVTNLLIHSLRFLLTSNS